MKQKNKGFTRPQGIRQDEVLREDSDAVKAGVWIDRLELALKHEVQRIVALVKADHGIN